MSLHWPKSLYGVTPQMGSRNQADPRSGAQVVKGLPPVSIGASRVGCLPGREPSYQMNPTLEILYRSPHVLH